ncbi:unnamed protein product [Soboliphyme baturini]|uniref:Saposin B-type domain-containing protein n=1 Tax=Soboliphyme baturini TaxID=241478 RepID=A0A183J8H5_9BILA|nr:unnamed protein product [Soboliphyme baturini]
MYTLCRLCKAFLSLNLGPVQQSRRDRSDKSANDDCVKLCKLQLKNSLQWLAVTVEKTPPKNSATQELGLESAVGVFKEFCSSFQEMSKCFSKCQQLPKDTMEILDVFYYMCVDKYEDFLKIFPCVEKYDVEISKQCKLTESVAEHSILPASRSLPSPVTEDTLAMSCR